MTKRSFLSGMSWNGLMCPRKSEISRICPCLIYLYPYEKVLPIRVGMSVFSRKGMGKAPIAPRITRMGL